MKAIVSGVLHRKGTAKESGKPYDFCMVKTLRPIEAFLSERMTVRGVGFSEVEIDAEPGVVEKLQGMKFPCELELETDARPNQFGKLEIVVTGVRK
jgi:CTX phage RstB protein